jgi:hypothetical protein
MAFCGSCGAGLNTSAPFCSSCGAKSVQPSTQAVPHVAPVSVTPTPVAPAPVVPTPAVVKTGSPIMKILMVVGVLIVCVVGALGYAAYWVKNKVETTAAEHGITLPSGGSGGSHRSSSSSHKPAADPCSFITKEEISSAIGIEMITAEAKESECVYRGSNIADVLVVEVSRGDAAITMTSVKASGKLMEMAPGTELQSLSDVGDEAAFQNGMLTARKGDDSLRLVMPATLLTANFGANMDMAANIAGMRNKAKAVAQIVLPRM